LAAIVSGFAGGFGIGSWARFWSDMGFSDVFGFATLAGVFFATFGVTLPSRAGLADFAGLVGAVLGFVLLAGLDLAVGDFFAGVGLARWLTSAFLLADEAFAFAGAGFLFLGCDMLVG
jgi:hypothetical protein